MDSKQKQTNMELKDLIGLHQLSGVDHLSIIMAGEECNAIAFTLDGITYSAAEDPDDGYRSYMSELIPSNIKLKNNFLSHHVMCRIEEDEEILAMFDIITDKCVLRIGTEDSDDYYPSCIIEWHPENLAVNNPIIKLPITVKPTMLTTTELRIGNIIWNDYSGEMLVDSILNEDTVWLRKTKNLPCCQYKCSEQGGVILYEQAVLDLGFKQIGKQKDFYKGKLFIHLRKKGWVIRKSMPPLKYVHQLQNAYFVFTGKEIAYPL